MNNNFISYRDYGLGPVNNLIYSYLVGWGDKGTYASNEHIAKTLGGYSYKTIQRALKELKDKGLIQITNPKGRSRFITIVRQPGQIVPLPGQNVPVTRTDSPTKMDKLSHNNNRDNNKNNNNDNTRYDISENTSTTFEERLQNQHLLDQYLKKYD